MIFVIIGLLVVIGFLVVKCLKKYEIHKELLEEYNKQLTEVEDKLEFSKKALNSYESKLLDTTIKYNTEYQKLNQAREQLEECEAANTKAIQAYNELVNVRTKEIDEIMEEQRQRRQESLDETFKEKKAFLESELAASVKQYDKQAEEAKQIAWSLVEEAQNKVKEYQLAEQQERERFESLRKPLMQYEMDKQRRLFYTIQLPEELHEDIEFLLTTVAAKVQHPDIISKLVWAEYVKPYLDETFKRIEIRPEPGIYKITNINSGKSYIGKSTNVKTRIADHFKSSVGIKSIADQAVHHAILKEGFWNWTIEIITYCEKERLSDLEKYYIDFFKTQEFGYNRNAGG